MLWLWSYFSEQLDPEQLSYAPVCKSVTYIFLPGKLNLAFKDPLKTNDKQPN